MPPPKFLTKSGRWRADVIAEKARGRRTLHLRFRKIVKIASRVFRGASAQLLWALAANNIPAVPFLGKVRDLRVVEIGAKPRNFFKSSDVLWIETKPIVTRVKYGEEALERSDEREPELCQYFELSDCTVAIPSRVAGIYTSEEYFVSNPKGDSPWRVYRGHDSRPQAGIIDQRADRILIREKKTIRIASGIYVGSWSPHNWYLWLSSWLPTIFLAKKLPSKFQDFPLILPLVAQGRKNWLSSLEAVWGHRNVLFVEPDTHYIFECLVYVESPINRGPYSINDPFNQNWRTIQKNFFRDFAKHMVTSSTGDRAQRITKRYPDRIFIFRDQSLNRPYNQEELLEVASDYGFAVVDFSQLSFSETVAHMRGVKTIVGAHGAGWANVIFCECRPDGIMWAEPGARTNNNLSNLAAAAEINLEILWMSVEPEGAQQSSPTRKPPKHTLNPQTLRNELRNLFE